MIAVALLPAWGAASAQDGRDLRVRIGAGAELRPQYPGADSSRIGPLISLSFAHGTDPFKFKGPDDSSGIALVSTKGFSLGLPPISLAAAGTRTSVRQSAGLPRPSKPVCSPGTGSAIIESGASF